MSKIEFFKGTSKWAKLDKVDDKYGLYSICLYLDEEGLAQFKAIGSSLTIKEDEDGSYIRLKRDPNKLFEDMAEKPTKLIRNGEGPQDYEPFEGLVGNGSKVTCKVIFFDTKAGKKGHRLEAVAVEELVEYTDNSNLPF